MKTIQELKKKLGIKDSEIANMFGYKNATSYQTSSAKKRIELGLVNIFSRYFDLEKLEKFIEELKSRRKEFLLPNVKITKKLFIENGEMSYCIGICNGLSNVYEVEEIFFDLTFEENIKNFRHRHQGAFKVDGYKYLIGVYSKNDFTGNWSNLIGYWNGTEVVEKKDALRYDSEEDAFKAKFSKDYRKGVQAEAYWLD